jgi:indolepyruvate ferredoxin oxidoreductase, beta subunit
MMTESRDIAFDPYNLIISGVGGQGNVVASRIVGNMLSAKGFTITIGETFGASQRGGSVMSHLRISAGGYRSPVMPKGGAHMILGMEPIESIRILRDYGHPGVKMICNMRPIQPVQVIAGEMTYPSLEDLRGWVEELTGQCWFIDATDRALQMGSPILGNTIMIGALAAAGELPLDRMSFQEIIAGTMSRDKVAVNLEAFDVGMKMITS